jgi:site-specific recombinase XerD
MKLGGFPINTVCSAIGTTRINATMQNATSAFEVSSATIFTQNGVPLGHTAELLKHRGLSMTRRYAHLSIWNLHEAVARIASSTDTPVAPDAERKAVGVAYIQ